MLFLVRIAISRFVEAIYPLASSGYSHRTLSLPKVSTVNSTERVVYLNLEIGGISVFNFSEYAL
jgi:hypothetical protein